MKRRRIDFGKHQIVGDVTEETDKWIRFQYLMLPDRQLFAIVRLLKFEPRYVGLGFHPSLWKPHEYRQEARRSCLFAYWYLKRRLGRDLAGLIAKTVWSTRFDFIWEGEGGVSFRAVLFFFLS